MGEGHLRAGRYPSPNPDSWTIGVALSHKGRGRSNKRRYLPCGSFAGELPTVAPLGWITPQAMRPPASPDGSVL